MEIPVEVVPVEVMKSSQITQALPKSSMPVLIPVKMSTQKALAKTVLAINPKILVPSTKRTTSPNNAFQKPENISPINRIVKGYAINFRSLQNISYSL